MKIRSIYRSWPGDDEDRLGLDIEIDGVIRFSVSDGEPEDMNLRRDLACCQNIVGLLAEAHAAGARGEPLAMDSITERDRS